MPSAAALAPVSLPAAVQLHGSSAVTSPGDRSHHTAGGSKSARKAQMGLKITLRSVLGFGKGSVPARAEKRWHPLPCHGRTGSTVPQGGQGDAPSSLPALTASREARQMGAFNREKGCRIRIQRERAKGAWRQQWEGCCKER